MSNSYLRFSSEPIYRVDDEEMAWLQERLDLDFYNMDDAALEAAGELLGFDVSTENSPWPGFEMHVDKIHRHVHFYSDEEGSLDNLVAFLSSFLQKFRPNCSMVISWSAFGDKNRVDDNGGGAFYLKGPIVESINTYDWVLSMKEKYER